MLYDKDIREPLFEFLDGMFGKNRVIEEKTIGRSRADVYMVTEDALYGIEIKSDADTYARLERQVKDYNRFFDYNLVAVGHSHSAHVAEHVPAWWGIITIEDLGTEKPFIFLLREPQRNPKREKEVMFRNQMGLLWRRELAHIQELNGMPKYARMSKINVTLKIMETVPRETLKRQLCEELFERDYTTIEADINAYRQEHSKPRKRKTRRRKKSVLAAVAEQLLK